MINDFDEIDILNDCATVPSSFQVFITKETKSGLLLRYYCAIFYFYVPYSVSDPLAPVKVVFSTHLPGNALLLSLKCLLDILIDLCSQYATCLRGMTLIF